MSNKFNVKLVDLTKVKSERISLKSIKMLQVASIFMENNFGSDFLRFPEEILITSFIFIIICLLAFLFECYQRCIKKRMINGINQNINRYNR